MKHIPSLCVLCNPCYSQWCYGQILAIAPLCQCMVENRRKTLSTTLHTSWESMRVNPIFSTHLGGDMSKVMKYIPSLCVLCNPCYSQWCYGQILAIAPLSQCMGENRRKTLSTTLHTSWESRRVNHVNSRKYFCNIKYYYYAFLRVYTR